MIDREKVVTVLRRRFPAAGADQIAAAANAIVGLDDEWEDITSLEPDLATHLRHACGDGCYLAGLPSDTRFRLLRHRAMRSR
jgi:hypothetical protein